MCTSRGNVRVLHVTLGWDRSLVHIPLRHFSGAVFLHRTQDGAELSPPLFAVLCGPGPRIASTVAVLDVRINVQMAELTRGTTPPPLPFLAHIQVKFTSTADRVLLSDDELIVDTHTKAIQVYHVSYE